MKKHLHKLLFCYLLFSFYSSPIMACSCLYEPIFCKNVTTENVVLATVLTVNPDVSNPVMEVKILEQLMHNISDTVITIDGGNGANCGQYLGVFVPQDTLVLALGVWEYDGINNYFLMGDCGLHYLRYENGMVSTSIFPDVNEMSYTDFKEDLPTCVALTFTEDKSVDRGQVTVFPNPVKDNLTVSVPQFLVTSVDIFSIHGQLLGRHEVFEFEEASFSVNGLTNGIYLARIQTSGGLVTKRFVVRR